MEVENLLKMSEIRPQGYKLSKIEDGACEQNSARQRKKKKKRLKKEPLICCLP